MKLEKNILAKLFNDKVKNFFNDYAQKKISKYLLLAGKLNKLYIYFMRWLNKVRLLKINDNAKIIQGFCRDILQKCKEKKELNNKIKLNNGLVILMKAKFGKGNAFNKIKSERNKNTNIEFKTQN